MRRLAIILSLPILLWACSSESIENEAYLQNLVEENEALLETIHKKNREIDRQNDRIYELESRLNFSSEGMPPTTGTPARQALSPAGEKNTLALSHTTEEETDGPKPDKNNIKSVSGKITLSHQPVLQTMKAASNQDALSVNLEAFLNQISDASIALSKRKKIKQEVMLSFVNGSVQVFNEKGGFVNQYTAAVLLDLLVDFPHRVKVNKVLKNRQDKIIELRLQMNRQKT